MVPFGSVTTSEDWVAVTILYCARVNPAVGAICVQSDVWRWKSRRSEYRQQEVVSVAGTDRC